MNLEKSYKTYSRTRGNTITPRQMLKILIYSNMNSIYSSREIEKACKRDINFMYLLDGASAPEHENSMVIVTYDNKLCNDIEIINDIKNCAFSNKNNLLLKVLGLSILIISMFFLGNNPLAGSTASSTINETSFLCYLF